MCTTRLEKNFFCFCFLLFGFCFCFQFVRSGMKCKITFRRSLKVSNGKTHTIEKTIFKGNKFTTFKKFFLPFFLSFLLPFFLFFFLFFFLLSIEIFQINNSNNKYQTTMLPPGVILVFCLIFVAFLLVSGVFIQKKLKARKSQQRF